MVAKAVRAGFAFAFALIRCSVIVGAPIPASASNVVTYTYQIAVKGTVVSDVNEFAGHVAATLTDPRGWSLGGSIRFEPVAAGGDFTLWLSQASLLPTF